MALPFCSVSLRCVHGFHLWSPFPYFYDLRAMAEAVCLCLCLLRLEAARVTSATTSTALRSAFLFVSFQFPIFSEFAVSACTSRPFLAIVANAI